MLPAGHRATEMLGRACCSAGQNFDLWRGSCRRGRGVARSVRNQQARAAAMPSSSIAATPSRARRHRPLGHILRAPPHAAGFEPAQYRALSLRLTGTHRSSGSFALVRPAPATQQSPLDGCAARRRRVPDDQYRLHQARTAPHRQRREALHSRTSGLQIRSPDARDRGRAHRSPVGAALAPSPACRTRDRHMQFAAAIVAGR